MMRELPTGAGGVPYMPDGWVEKELHSARGVLATAWSRLLRRDSEPERRQPRESAGVGVLLLKLAGLYVLLDVLYFLIPNEVLREFVIHYGVVEVSAALINLIDPSAAVQAASGVLTSTRATLEVVRGCDGSGSMFLIVAAVVAFPSSVREKIAGVALGLLLMFLLNQVRIVGLYFVLTRESQWFSPIHLYFAPTLVILVGALFFHEWVARVGWKSLDRLADA
jgi:exosortase family protein XrtM